MTAVVQLIRYMKGVKIFHLFCERCESQFKKELPVTMRLTQVICPHCETDGFVIGHAKKNHH